ncbi:MAG: nuclear transport factor 2 family protein [Pseudomonadota bacterium]
MTTEELAQGFTKCVIEDDEAGYQAYWSDDIVSIEPGDGEMARVEGREALLGKHAWWNANTEMHSVTTQGPYVNGDQFMIRYAMDVTMDGERSQMAEIGVYDVKDGKIVQEQFIYGSGENA